MTEDEAKTKWCCGPPAMVALTINHAAGTTNEEPLKCLGSACVAWRWDGPEIEQKMVHTTEIKQWESSGWRVVKSYDDYQTLMHRQPSTNKPSGFCGLATRPDK